MSDIGASLPPHLLAKRKRKQEDEAESAPATASGAKKSPSLENAEKKRKIAGPALPPAPLEQRPTEPANTGDDSSSDDDDDFGPALPSAAAANDDDDLGPSQPEPPPAAEKQKRDDWMTMPPEQDDLAARMDPTKIRARGFNTGKGAKAPHDKGGDSSAWHETPEQKQKRLEDEMMGIARPEVGLAKPAKPATSAKDEEAARRVKEHSVGRNAVSTHCGEHADDLQKSRGPSLMDQHKGEKPEADDDPSKRAFDREKDMGSGMIGRGQRKDLLNKATGFSSKFSGGSYL